MSRTHRTHQVLSDERPPKVRGLSAFAVRERRTICRRCHGRPIDCPACDGSGYRPGTAVRQLAGAWEVRSA